MCLDHALGADMAVANHAVGTDAHPFTQFHLAFEHAADVDLHVVAAAQAAAHVEARRVGQRHALGHQPLGNGLLVGALEARHLGAVVDPLDFHGAGRLGGGDAHSFGGGQRDHVGQVVLALGVIRRQLRQPAAQLGAGHRHNPGIALLDRPLALAGILVLDDGHRLAGGVAQDTPIAAGVVEGHGEQCHLLFADAVEQCRQGLAPNQGHIAVQHQHLVGPQRIKRLGHRMAGALLLGLHGEAHRAVAQRLAKLVATVADHHVQFLGAKRCGRVDDVTHHRLAGQAVQHLGPRRTHPCALTGG